MPRSSYKPYKRNYRSYSNKKKWAPVLRDIPATQYPIGPTSTEATYFTCVENSAETATPTPTIIKVKHLKLSLDILADATVLNNGFCALIYLPQGYTFNAGLPIQHPEWILGWRNIPNVVSATHHNIMLNSSLSRNLNSGDKVICMFSFYNSATGPTTFGFTARYSCVVRNN